MTVFTKGTWAGGCIHTIVSDDVEEPAVETIADWLRSLTFNEFCDALQEMIDTGYMDEDKADKTYNAYANTNERN